MEDENLPVKKIDTQIVKNISFDKGIIPKDYDDVMRLAGLMHASGLAPDSLDTGQKVAIAMMMAMEVGMPIITGIANIAVIKGKASIWGDAALSLIRRSGKLEVFEEWSEGKRKTTEWIFYCKVKRKGHKEAIGSFSWEEAIEAGLDSAKMPLPWARWTNRMMQFKARNFVLRDTFGDVLRGIALTEDLQDSIINVTPEKKQIELPPHTEKVDYVVETPDTDVPEKEVEQEDEEKEEDIKETVQVVGPIEEKEFNRKQESGYSTWVVENLKNGRVPACSQDMIAKIIDKWGKVYDEPVLPGLQALMIVTHDEITPATKFQIAELQDLVQSKWPNRDHYEVAWKEMCKGGKLSEMEAQNLIDNFNPAASDYIDSRVAP